MKKEIKTQELNNEQNIGILSNVYKFIKGEFFELQEATGCPDNFYNFI